MSCSTSLYPGNCAETTQLGRLINAGGEAFVDDFALWQRELTAGDVDFIYQAGLDAQGLDQLVLSEPALYIYRTPATIAIKRKSLLRYDTLTADEDGMVVTQGTPVPAADVHSCDVRSMGLRTIVEIPTANGFSAQAGVTER